MLGSLAIAVNSLAGPAILQLPFTYQQSGVIPTTVALILVAVMSALCCMHMANVVSKVPGNANFDKVVEFSDPFQTFWSQRAYYATQIIFYLCTLCINTAAIVDTAEIVDSFLGHSVGTWGFAFDKGEFQEWIHDRPCSRSKVKLGHCLPFESNKYGLVLLTMGYLITAAVFVPICLMDLKVRLFDDTIIVHWFVQFCIRHSPFIYTTRTFDRKIQIGKSLALSCCSQSVPNSFYVLFKMD
jgi:hypothetical protein